MSDCKDCNDDEAELVCGDEAITSENNTCATICNEAFQNLDRLDKVSLIGTRAPNGKCLHKLKGSVGLVVSDVDGQCVTNKPKGALYNHEVLIDPVENENDETDLQIKGIVIEDADGCAYVLTAPTSPSPDGKDWYVVAKGDGSGQFKLIDGTQSGALTSSCWGNDLVEPISYGPGVGLGLLYTSGDFSCIRRSAGQPTVKWIQLETDGTITYVDPVVVPDLVAPPVSDPECYYYGSNASGDPEWLLRRRTPIVAWTGDVDDTGDTGWFALDNKNYSMMQVVYQNQTAAGSPGARIYVDFADSAAGSGTEEWGTLHLGDPVPGIGTNDSQASHLGTHPDKGFCRVRVESGRVTRVKVYN